MFYHSILFIFLVGLSLLTGCGSTPGSPNSAILEPAPAAPEAPTEEVVYGQNAESLRRLESKLAELGYQGVGLQFEKPAVLDVLYSVFSDPRAHGRKIKLVYTGLENSYDSTHESVTLGGTTEVPVMLKFISGIGMRPLEVAKEPKDPDLAQ